jgi:hypothetical protein
MAASAMAARSFSAISVAPCSLFGRPAIGAGKHASQGVEKLSTAKRLHQAGGWPTKASQIRLWCRLRKACDHHCREHGLGVSEMPQHGTAIDPVHQVDVRDYGDQTLHGFGEGERRFPGVRENNLIPGSLKNVPDHDGDQRLVLDDENHGRR